MSSKTELDTRKFLESIQKFIPEVRNEKYL